MKTDPMNNVDVEPISPPPRAGAGSSRQAWVSYAEALADANLSAFDLIRRQSQVIRNLQAEIERLDQRIAERKPKGGRPKIEAKRIAEIERDLAAGYSMRATAVRCGVSAMTVSRIAGSIQLGEAHGEQSN